MEVYLLEQYDNTAVIKSDGNGGDGDYTNMSWIHGINMRVYLLEQYNYTALIKSDSSTNRKENKAQSLIL